MPNISDALRVRVTRRAKRLCEYCLSPESIGIPMDVDHIVPRHSGGTTTEGNLCLSCPNCNKSKGTRQTALDPVTGAEVPLFNPRQHKWTEHFQWNDTGLIILGLTPTGRATIERLQMNRQNLVEDARPQWIILGIHPPKHLS